MNSARDGNAARDGGTAAKAATCQKDGKCYDVKLSLTSLDDVDGGRSLYFTVFHVAAAEC